MTQISPATVEAPSVVPLDREELHQLYLLHQGALFTFFSNRGFRPDECRDLLQQTFLEAWRSRGSCRGENVAGWLFGIAANLWRMHLRDRSRQKREGQEVPLESPDPESESGRFSKHEVADPQVANRPLEKCLAEEEKRLLHGALLALPERMRFCVVLRLRGYKYREIADLLKVTLNTVRKQLFDSRELLRQQLGSYFWDLAGEEREES